MPSPDTIPTRFPSPFDDTGPHPLARDAALALQEQLRSGWIAPGVPTEILERPEGGKMFGVLIATGASGAVGSGTGGSMSPGPGTFRVMKAFSGQLGSILDLPGWAPPLFDVTARGVIEPESTRRIKELTDAMDGLARSLSMREERGTVDAERLAYATARIALKTPYEERRQARRERRETISPDDRAARRHLDNDSRRDDIALRGELMALREAHVARLRLVRPLDRRLRAMERLRRAISRRVMRGIHDTYRLTNRLGETTTLRALFTPGEPPWGAGDCAAPKLIAAAVREGLTPVALAEFWWGAPPPGGARVQGAFYPACMPKCGPILPFLLSGIDVAPRVTWKPAAEESDHLDIRHDDGRIVVVVKPAGLLSVPARDEMITDSAFARLRRQYPDATGPLLVHRLDLDTSGVLVVALDEEVHRDLQAQLLRREVRKRYVAWVDGDLPADRGTISLPMRVDLDQRPRQVVDFVHGKEAITDWSVLERRDGRTRVAMFPRTGRTHQLRVHAAHAAGLGAAIVGDRLYGTPGERLMLHAESISFRHPNGRRVTVADPAPF